MPESPSTDFSNGQAVLRVPRATYRLQLRADFDFAQIGDLIDYLQSLGVSDLYLSPLFRARRDSSHGYDVVDHSVVSEEFGGAEKFAALAERLRQRDMGLLLDIVPNHMGVNDRNNRWWNDVLENGAASRYVRYFDIDWQRSTESLHNRLLLPVLGDLFGNVLDRGELKLSYGFGRFHIHYFNTRFPVTPLTWPSILQVAVLYLEDLQAASKELVLEEELLEGSPDELDPDGLAAAHMELESIATQLRNLSARAHLDSQGSRERYREQAIAARRLDHLVDRSTAVQVSLGQALTTINGRTGEPASFEMMEALLDNQWYRLAFWRVAADEINYRRFFDINEMAAIRVELPEVFQAVHQLVEQLLAKRQITGLRIDHPDGLLDPKRYLEELQKLYRRCQPADPDAPPRELYVVVEKILSGDERLPSDWRVSGTTGYELMHQLNCLLVDGAGLERLRSGYADLTGIHETAAEIVYQSKKRIIDDAMSSELHVLASQLHRISQRMRWSRDFTFSALLRTLREVIACFQVYRTYVSSRGWEADPADHGRVMNAIRLAKRRNPTMSWAALDYVGSVLLLQFSSNLEPAMREELREFVLKFQQVTGPITAKGTEDTAFYRYYPLASLNEVGGELDAPALSVEQFHHRMQHRAVDWPHSLSATGTHDTKRGEDVRARLHVLSEVAERWLSQVTRWCELNQPKLHSLSHGTVPSANEQVLLYQTLVGTWHSDRGAKSWAGYRERIIDYMRKALREAKLNTSWANPSAEYEEAVTTFINDLLDREKSSQFLEELDAFVLSISDAGFVNSLGQLLLKATVPGVPDFYQGTELWDFRLVDPDNRGRVDFAKRRQWLQNMQRAAEKDPQGLLERLLADWPHPRIKLWLAWRLLRARADAPEIFQSGEYVPLEATGGAAPHVVAFARRAPRGQAIAATALHSCSLLAGAGGGRATRGAPRFDWRDTAIRLPADAPDRWTDALGGRSIEARALADGARVLTAEQLFGQLPVALLISFRD